MIYTSYFGRLRELERNGIAPVAISRSVPNGFKGRRIMELAPTWAMLKMSDADYDRCYEDILAGLDRKMLVESFGGQDVALLCWEKDVNECHRKRVGEWLREGGYEAEEYKSEAERKAIEKAKREEEKQNEVLTQSAMVVTWEQLSFI